MSPGTVAAILDRVRARWPVANDLEVTLEANPGIRRGRAVRAYAQGGVSRVSLGVQALNDADLRRLGRIHDTADARRAIGIARTTFDRVSFDLIYARQAQTLDAWRAELREALDMGPITCRSISSRSNREPRSAAATRSGGLRISPRTVFAPTCTKQRRICAKRVAWKPYEVSNHARPGAESRHNLIYWRHGDYAGIGPGAHGRSRSMARADRHGNLVGPGSVAERRRGRAGQRRWSPLSRPTSRRPNTWSWACASARGSTWRASPRSAVRPRPRGHRASRGDGHARPGGRHAPGNPSGPDASERGHPGPPSGLSRPRRQALGPLRSRQSVSRSSRDA